jgi:hypothetical protein
MDEFNSSLRDDEVPLMELAVVLLFLVDILGFLLEPNTKYGQQFLWCSEAIPHKQWKKTKDSKALTQMDMQMENRKLFLNSEFLKSQSPLQVSVDLLL